MRRLLTCLAILPLLALTACPSQQTTATVANSVAEAEVMLTAAEDTAKIYVTFPNCPALKGGLCSTEANRQKIKDLDNTAFAAVKLARSNAGTVAAAVSAIAALIAATPPTH